MVWGCPKGLELWKDGKPPNPPLWFPNEPPVKPVGCDSNGPELGNPVICGASEGWGPWKPVGCGANEVGEGPWNPVGCGASEGGVGWKPVGCVFRKLGFALCGRAGTKLLKPVVVGIRGCKRLWLAGTGANGPRGPLLPNGDGWGEGSSPVCCACRCCPMGTGELPIPIPEVKPAGIVADAARGGNGETARL